MKIGIISDTHDKIENLKKVKEVFILFNNIFMLEDALNFLKLLRK